MHGHFVTVLRGNDLGLAPPRPSAVAPQAPHRVGLSSAAAFGERVAAPPSFQRPPSYSLFAPSSPALRLRALPRRCRTLHSAGQLLSLGCLACVLPRSLRSLQNSARSPFGAVLSAGGVTGPHSFPFAACDNLCLPAVLRPCQTLHFASPRSRSSPSEGRVRFLYQPSPLPAHGARACPDPRPSFVAWAVRSRRGLSHRVIERADQTGNEGSPLSNPFTVPAIRISDTAL